MGIPPDRILEFLDSGLVQAVRRQDTLLRFDAETVLRFRLIYRLRRDLGINLEGIAVVLDLLDKLRALQRDNERLRHRV